MSSPFEVAARVAIEEIILDHADASKFGYFLSKDSVKTLTNDLYDLLKTSRSLKSLGDRMMQGGADTTPSKPTRPL